MSFVNAESGSSIVYGVAVDEVGRRRGIYQENADQVLETMSAIKSPIGTLAIEKAVSDGYDIGSLSMKIRASHYSNGSGRLSENDVFKENDQEEASLILTLDEILYSNIVESDCVATNALIDYLGGKIAVNEALRSTLGVETMTLMTDRIYFRGVDHRETPFQVGSGSMSDFVRYYRTIWSPDSHWRPRSQAAHDWHLSIHTRKKDTKLLNMRQGDLPQDFNWVRKSGSGFDQRPDVFYGAVVEAGMLQTKGRTLFIAAGITELKDDPLCGDEKELLKEEFAKRNIHALGLSGIELIQLESVAA